MDEIRNKESSTISCNKVQELIDANPKLAHEEFSEGNHTQPRTGLQALRDLRL